MLALTLPETLDRKSVGELWKTLVSHRGPDVMLDAGGVRRVAATGLDLLVSAARQWSADGKTFDSRDWGDEARADLAGLGADGTVFAAGGPA